MQGAAEWKPPQMTSVLLLSWVAVLAYVAATVLAGVDLVFDRPRLGTLGRRATVAGILPHSVAILIRWNISAHGPYMAKHEVLLSMSWVAIVFYLIATRTVPLLKQISVLVLPMAFLLLAAGLLADPAVHSLPPTLKSLWLVIHVLFNKIAAGSMLIAVAAALGLLLKNRTPASRIGRRLPSLRELDHLSRRFITFGFFFWSITIAAGSIWANEAWGRYWGWDPIETWSLITWLCFGGYLHLRRFTTISEKSAALVAVACLIISLVTLFFIPLLPGSLHTEYFK